MSKAIIPVERHPPNFVAYSPRNDKHMRNELNENRFESIERSPKILTQTKESPNVFFGKMVSRNVHKTVYPQKEYQCEYENVDTQQINQMRRLNANIIKFRRQPPRKIGEGFGGYLRPQRDIQTLSVCDDMQVISASLSKVNDKKKSIASCNMRVNLPRDLKMYQETERLRNISMENSRDQRAKDLDRMKRLRKMGNSYTGYAQ